MVRGLVTKLCKKTYNNQPLSNRYRCGVSSNVGGGMHHAESRSGSKDEDTDVLAQSGAEEEDEDKSMQGGEDVAARTRKRMWRQGQGLHGGARRQ